MNLESVIVFVREFKRFMQEMLPRPLATLLSLSLVLRTYLSGVFTAPLFCPLKNGRGDVIIGNLSITATLVAKQKRKRDAANAFIKH